MEDEEFHEDMVIVGSSRINEYKTESPVESESASLSSPSPPPPGPRRRVDSVGDFIPMTIPLSKVIGGGAGGNNYNSNFAISSIQNSPRVMRAAVFTHDRPFDRPFESRKSSEDLLMIRSSLGAASRSLDPKAWAQVAIPIDLEPFLHPEKLFYPVVDSPK